MCTEEGGAADRATLRDHLAGMIVNAKIFLQTPPGAANVLRH